VSDDKYIVFKRDDFDAMMVPHAMNFATAEQHFQGLTSMALNDAVVIRRQDLFAGPALHSYAAAIAIADRLSNDSGLRPIADYFHEQAVLADAEGWKLPD
jgi:hypothetical protein